ncbi:hypothetical protein [Burkholderia cepacia]|uniref:hypothetical protein n=1 Tax=Burkholderia cepacia TaxID=292 RepID=UPI001F3130BC|nr:hypothetical protein [Burkholderia cepacia]MCE4124547.1 hypothetical protein [Burkholderia cepacia]
MLSVQWLERIYRHMLALSGFRRRERDGTYGGIVTPKYLVARFVRDDIGKMDIVFPSRSAERHEVLAGFFRYGGRYRRGSKVPKRRRLEAPD